MRWSPGMPIVQTWAKPDLKLASAREPSCGRAFSRRAGAPPRFRRRTPPRAPVRDASPAVREATSVRADPSSRSSTRRTNLRHRSGAPVRTRTHRAIPRGNRSIRNLGANRPRSAASTRPCKNANNSSCRGCPNASRSVATDRSNAPRASIPAQRQKLHMPLDPRPIPVGVVHPVRHDLRLALRPIPRRLEHPRPRIPLTITTTPERHPPMPCGHVLAHRVSHVAVHASFPLLEVHGVPRQVPVNHRVAV